MTARKIKRDWSKFDHKYRGHRVQKTVNCATEEEHRHYHKTLKGLCRTDELFQWVEAIIAGTVTIDQVVEDFDNQTLLSKEPYKKVVRLFQKVKSKKDDGDVFKWCDTTKEPASPYTIDRYRRCFKNMKKLNPTAKLTDLPDVLKSYRKRCQKNDTAYEFRNAKFACQAYVRQRHGGKHTPLWNKLAAIQKLKIEPKGEPKDVTPEKAWQIAPQLPAKVRPAFWMCLLTGMRAIAEYEEHKWTVGDNHIHIARSKNDKSKRVVPLVLLPGEFEIFPSDLPCSRDYFSRCLATLGYTIRDLRRSYMAILEEDVGLSHAMVQYYAGHKTAKDRTAFYQRARAGDTTQLEQHADKIRETIWGGKPEVAAVRKGLKAFADAQPKIINL